VSVQLVSKITDLCDPDPSTSHSQTDKQTKSLKICYGCLDF